MKNLFLLLTIVPLLLLTGNLTLKSNELSIKGSILSSNDSTAYVGAKVIIKDTEKGALVSKEGFFQIDNLEYGNYNIIVKYAGKTILDTIINLTTSIDLGKFYILRRFTTEEIKVYSTKLSSNVKDSPISISVATPQDFGNALSNNVRDGIRFQPGLRVETNCQNCGFSQIRLNGLEGKYSQILINSKPVFSSINSMYGLEQIPINMIEQVELIRGGGSSMYAGNAIAGVINIITKTPVENSYFINFDNFSFGPFENSLQVGSSLISNDESLGTYIIGNIRNREFLDIDGDGFSEIPRINNYSAGVNAFYKPNIDSKLSLESYFINEYRRGGDNFENAPHKAMMAEEMKHNISITSLSYETMFTDHSKLSLYSSLNFTQKENYTGVEQDINGYGNTNSNVVNLGAMYAFHTHESEIDETVKNSYIIGAEMLRDNTLSRALGYGFELDQSTLLFGFYSQANFIISDDFTLLTGFRLDRHNLINNLMFNPRVSVMFKLNHDLILKANVSTGYRTPQAYDDDLHASMRGGQRVIVRLDPNLKEERSISYSINLDYNFQISYVNFNFLIDGFYTDLYSAHNNSFMGNDQFGNYVYFKENTGGANVGGISLELSANKLLDFDLSVNLTMQNAIYSDNFTWFEDEVSGHEFSTKQMLKTPNVYGSFLANYNYSNNLSFSINTIYTGSMWVAHLPGFIEEARLVRTNDFIELGLGINYKLEFFESMVLKFGIINILNSFQRDFDRTYNRDSDYVYGPLRPRMLTFGLSYEN